MIITLVLVIMSPVMRHGSWQDHDWFLIVDLGRWAVEGEGVLQADAAQD